MYRSNFKKLLPIVATAWLMGAPSVWAQAPAGNKQMSSAAAQPQARQLTLREAFELAWSRQPEARSQDVRQEAVSAARSAASSWTVESPALELLVVPLPPTVREQAYRFLEEQLLLRPQRCVESQLPLPHLSVTLQRGTKTLPLDLPRPLDPLTDSLGALPSHRPPQLPDLDTGDFEDDVNPVQEGFGEP